MSRAVPLTARSGDFPIPARPSKLGGSSSPPNASQARSFSSTIGLFHLFFIKQRDIDVSIDGKQSPHVLVAVTVSQHARDLANFAIAFSLVFFFIFLLSFILFCLFSSLFYWLDTINKEVRVRLVYVALPKSHYRHKKCSAICPHLLE